MASEVPTEMNRQSRPLSFFDDNFVAPLASMEDLSVLMTPMSTPGPTPGPSPKTRARWSHRISSGNQFDPLPPINDDVVLELPVPNGRSTERLPEKPPNSLLRKSLLANSRKNYPACPCMLHEEDESQKRNLSPPSQESGEKLFGNGGTNLNHNHWERKRPTGNRLASPVWHRDDADERRRILDDSDYPFIRPRDVRTSPDDVDDDFDDEKAKFIDDSRSPFLKPRQVTFVHSTPSGRHSHPTSPVTASPSSRRESASQRDSSLTHPSSRSSPEFSSLVRANGGRLKPEAMKPPTDRFHEALRIFYSSATLASTGWVRTTIKL